MNFPGIQAVLFDLDGTLVDSVPDIAVAIDHTLTALGLPGCDEDAVRQWVGNGAERLLHRALTRRFDGEADAGLLQRARPLYRQAYRERVCVASQVYPGVHSALQTLQARGVQLACVTNKPEELATPLLAALDLLAFFATVVGGECTPQRKPAPDALWVAAERLGVPIAHTLMVGDSLNDVGAARNAGCAGVVCVPYGYNHGRNVADAGPDAVIATLADLPPLLS